MEEPWENGIESRNCGGFSMWKGVLLRAEADERRQILVEGQEILHESLIEDKETSANPIESGWAWSASWRHAQKHWEEEGGYVMAVTCHVSLHNLWLREAETPHP